MIRRHNIVIIGSGAAAYSTADWLLKYGIKDICIISENRFAGTSRNAGSDKQTYYKISFTQADSADAMADSISCGGGMHKDIALIESANSARCFMRLVEYGVPFPHDKFGRYIGFKTDHDNTARGASAGPLTSKYMTECLEKKVLNSEEITFIDCATVIKIVTENKVAVGVIYIQDADSDCDIRAINANYIVMATGGAACIYKNTAYPESQSGALSLAIDAGASLNNICEWQYGIASTSVKWNLSGSYQQVIPRYYSIDNSGKEYEFLPKVFGCCNRANSAVFMKGYQWPFDSKRIDESSLVDIAVAEEIRSGRQVYIDYTRNPVGYEFSELSDEAQSYLLAADSVKSTPIERLKSLNPKAIEFYKEHSIDLNKEPLPIAVCAQHMNGGVRVDTDWQTDIKGLFAVGEVAGTFGIYRPGGTALNSSQVGGLRIAQYIKNNDKTNIESDDLFENLIMQERRFVESCIANKRNDMTDFCEEMSLYVAECRYIEKIKVLYEKICRQINKRVYSINQWDYNELRRLYKYKDCIISQKALCRTLLAVMPKIGSRGGALSYIEEKLIQENKEMRNYCIITSDDDVTFEPLRPQPDLNYNFEKTWQEYNIINNK